MFGTLINALAVLAGTMLGLLAGGRLPAQTQASVITGMGLVTLSLGVQNSFSTGNILIPLFSIALGVILGEGLNLHERLNGLGGWLQGRVARADADPASGRERFINGFVTASLVFCVGPLTILGSLQDGMTGDAQLLIIKSALDFFASMAFAASLGVGVGFSVLTILSVQGGLALLGALAGQVMTQVMIDELTATGGLILIGLAFVLLDVKQTRMANFLPALALAPLIVALGAAFGLDLYPNL